MTTACALCNADFGPYGATPALTKTGSTHENGQHDRDKYEAEQTKDFPEPVPMPINPKGDQ